MGTSDDTQSSGYTTLKLTELDDGQWRATQIGHTLAGYGTTGALAAMDYCRKVAQSHGDD